MLRRLVPALLWTAAACGQADPQARLADSLMALPDTLNLQALPNSSIHAVRHFGDRDSPRHAAFVAEDERRLALRLITNEVNELIREDSGGSCSLSDDSIATLVRTRQGQRAEQLVNAGCPGLRIERLLRRAARVEYARFSGGGRCRAGRARIEALVREHPDWRNEHIVEVACRLISDGMTTEQVRASIGRPRQTREEAVAGVQSLIWTYPDGRILRELVFAGDTLRNQRVCTSPGRCL